MKQPQPIIVSHLFSELLERLLTLLSGLTAEEWERATVCEGWSVQDVALHLLGVEVGILSRKRDGFSHSSSATGYSGTLVDIVNDLNATWVQAARRISPRLLCDLLQLTGQQACEYWGSLDPYALGAPVSWAGSGPAPVWLDLAREYTERWHHQQHIRDAVGRPGLKEPKFLAPVLDAFVRALPLTYRQVDAPEGTLVALTISGRSGSRWSLLRENGEWSLYLDVAHKPNAEVTIDQEMAWRLFTKGLDEQEALANVSVVGDQPLGLKVLDMVSIIA
jgi:uncharacterized protein (TIGR03083 family)